MPRIRTIKPEFWDSPGTAQASLRARLFFIAMWNWADDHGRGTANAKQLTAFAFPNDDGITAKEFPSLSKEVADCFGVVFYEVDGRHYFEIPSWDKHQRTERKAKGIHPAAPLGNTGQSTSEGTSDGSEGTSFDTQGSSGLGTGEQGNRGTGEQSPPVGSSQPSAAVISKAFEEAYGAWPKKVERKQALERFKVAVKKRGGVDELVADVKRFGAAYAATTDTKFVPALGVWLGRERWTDELPTGAAAAPQQPKPMKPRVTADTPYEHEAIRD